MDQWLYMTDSYLKSFDATVIALDEGQNAAILDRSAFFPGGGGQPADSGLLAVDGVEHPVKAAVKSPEGCLHLLEGRLPAVGARCEGRIDWERRHKLMRTHSAMHILCGVVWRDYQAKVTGGNMDIDGARMDFEMSTFTREMIAELEGKVNAEVARNRQIKVRILPREEAFAIPDLIRTKINLLPEGIAEVRTVEIVGLDLQADGGTHVSATAEIGRIVIADYASKGRINKRLYVKIEDGR